MNAAPMRALLSLFLLATMAGASLGWQPEIANPIRLPLLSSDAGGSPVSGVSCLSWRLGVETNNIVGWKAVPKACEDYVAHYMVGKQYREDFKVVVGKALLYLKSLDLVNDGKNVWVFDIDETTLSNLAYYAEHHFGAVPRNSTSYNEWVSTSQCKALPEALKLYKKLLEMGIKVVFITGRLEARRNATVKNLKIEGYNSWEKLILKTSTYSNTTALVYKSTERKKLVQEGYRIIGGMGDQWSDLLGGNAGNRTFKLPNPMYYIS